MHPVRFCLVCAVWLISAPSWGQAQAQRVPLTGEDGCPEGFVALAGEACMVAPAARESNEKAIIYFHGMLTSPWATKSKWELGQLARFAVARGYTVIGLRGVKGWCEWSDDARQNFCWPSGLRQQERLQPVIDRMRDAMADAASKTGFRFKAPFVCGFSNGGFLVSLIASDTRFAVTGYAIAHGGPVVGQGFPPWRRRPMLLVTASGDGYHYPRMKTLSQMLVEDRWEYAFTVREGVHEMTSEDFKAIVEFFDKV